MRLSARSHHLEVSAYTEASVHESAKAGISELYSAYVRDKRQLTFLVIKMGISFPINPSIHRHFCHILELLNKKKAL